MIEGFDPQNQEHVRLLTQATKRRAQVMYETTVNDSGEPLPEDAMLYWQLRTAAAEERTARALQIASAADKAASFYAACAVLFFLSFVFTIVAWAAK